MLDLYSINWLKKAGAIVDIDIPDRIKDGYGISKELIDLAYQAGTDTIITCDNGISAMEQVAYAKVLNDSDCDRSSRDSI